MTSTFDRQTNCLVKPQRDLVLGFLLISLDPLTPGMLQDVYDAAWVGWGGVGGPYEIDFRAAFALYNVHIDPFDFVVSGVGVWFAAWAASLSDGESDLSAPCVCNSF